MSFNDESRKIKLVERPFYKKKLLTKYHPSYNTALKISDLNCMTGDVFY